jgi:hypothetical protein
MISTEEILRKIAELQALLPPPATEVEVLLEEIDDEKSQKSKDDERKISKEEELMKRDEAVKLRIAQSKKRQSSLTNFFHKTSRDMTSLQVEEQSLKIKKVVIERNIVEKKRKANLIATINSYDDAKKSSRVVVEDLKEDNSDVSITQMRMTIDSTATVETFPSQTSSGKKKKWYERPKNWTVIGEHYLIYGKAATLRIFPVF